MKNQPRIWVDGSNAEPIYYLINSCYQTRKMQKVENKINKADPPKGKRISSSEATVTVTCVPAALALSKLPFTVHTIYDIRE